MYNNTVYTQLWKQKREDVGTGGDKEVEAVERRAHASWVGEKTQYSADNTASLDQDGEDISEHGGSVGKKD